MFSFCEKVPAYLSSPGSDTELWVEGNMGYVVKIYIKSITLYYFLVLLLLYFRQFYLKNICWKQYSTFLGFLSNFNANDLRLRYWNEEGC